MLFRAILAICLILCPLSDALARQAVKAAILYNLTDDKILYQYNPNLPLAPASLTKIMTMFLVMDAIKSRKLSYGQKIPVSGVAASVGGSSMNLKAGERVPVVRLLAGAAVISGNDAAQTLAEAVGRGSAAFVKKMNAKASSLGMKKTKFKNATGLPAAGQKTTVYDLLLLCKAYLKKHPEALRFHKMLYLLHKGVVVRNTNPLLGVADGVDGLKTGWTVDAGYNLIATAKRGKTRLIVIVMGGKTKADRALVSRKLLDAGFKNPRAPAKVKAIMDAG